ncbi:Sec-independent protein translocase TatA [Amylibacter sp. SFDW26]|uniref:twin-arginine translocase TatA/TatE family subunit n=1 Tax=Amylibacter sp. SFDW26 TaxID=2652722 RepID=UPI0012618E70|nr:twin-arginine translocase TatA/TatE family subunit [Amylibacter sp. SFDW26]KAB7616267.1 Sec-independent protein translocase TatA [Amylibacter sp. SFDW26]
MFLHTPLFIQNIGLPGILLIAVVVLLLFGRGKVSNLMGEVGKGITAFKKGVSEGKEEMDAAIDDASETAKDITPEKDGSKKG